MKKLICLMCLSALLIGLMASCNAPSPDPESTPYTLEYTSLGNGTCSVRIVTNPDYQEMFDVVIPETSPDGETVVEVPRQRFANWVPRYIEKSDFERIILHPMEEHYGLTREQAREILDEKDSEKVQTAFDMLKYLSYYQFVSLQNAENDAERKEILENYPPAEEMELYVMNSFVQEHEILRLMVLFYELEIDPVDVMQAHEKVQYIDTDQYSGWYIRSVSLPSTATTLHDRAFRFCPNLTEIHIPSSIEHLSPALFVGCFHLTSIQFAGTIAEWNAIEKEDSWNQDVPTSCIIHCTDGDISIE